MASIIAIMGQSGSGKTTSLRKLDPATTFIIDADRKGLSWAGWKKSYVEGKNYLRESNPADVQAALNAISQRMPHVKLVIIDTVNSIMIDDEMKRLKEKGYDKWSDLAQTVYGLISDANVLRDDLVIVFTFHCEVCEDELGGNRLVRFQTNGRKLQKISLEAKFPTVLFSKAKGDGAEGYIFETQSKQSVAKSPMGMFPTFEIPNDLAYVVDRVRAFDNEDGPLVKVENNLTAGAEAYRKATPEEAFKKHQECFGVLAGLQQRDGIANFKLIEFLRANGMFDGCKTLEDLSDEFMAKICKPDNWAQIVSELAPKATPAKEAPAAKVATIGDVFDTVAEIRKAAAESKISDNELTGFLIQQGMVEKGQSWWEAGEEILKMMADPATWGNIVSKIAGMPF